MTKMDAEGNTWYQSMKDPSVYVNDPALVRRCEVTPESATRKKEPASVTVV